MDGGGPLTGPVDRVLCKLDGIRTTGPNQWEATCPAHEDHNPSLGISTGDDDRVLLKCHAGCTTEAVVAAIGLTAGDLFTENANRNGESRAEIVATYDYLDAAGKLLFQVVRKRPKVFKQRRPDVSKGGWIWNLQGVTNRPLYRLPAVLEAVAEGEPVWVCEGEKDAERLQGELPNGQVATTAPGGAGKWRKEHTDALVGAEVTIVADDDVPGRKHAEQVRRAVEPVALAVRVVVPVKGKDVSDHLAAGRTVEELVEVEVTDPGILAPQVEVDARDVDVPESACALADGHRATDVGNADRLAAFLDGRGRYVHAWRKWAVYSNGRWNVDAGEALITEHAKMVARTMFSTAAELAGHDRDELWKWAIRTEGADKIARMIRLTRGIAGVLIEHTELDQHPWLLNVVNGTIDLRTGELLPHDPGHLLSKQAPVIFDPKAEAPLWHQCLERWQPAPDVRGYLQLLIGSAAAGRHVEHLFVNFGTGANGKGKFFGAVAAVLGPDYCIVPHKSLLISQRHEQHDTVKARLFGARMAVAAETDAGDKLDEAKVKELTGGDLLEARRMHEDPWQFAPSHTMFVHTNYRPRIRGGDEGIWRRVRLIPWNVTIPQAEWDTGLADKLHAEASGILNWIVAGAQQWHEHGFDVPDVITDATRDYRDDEDHVGRFLADCCDTGDDLAVPAKALREVYERWCMDVGETPWNAKNVGAQLSARGLSSARTGKARTHTWIGVDIAAKTGESP